MTAKKACFHGSWYPASPGECENEIEKFIAKADAKEGPDERNIGAITPHAGWLFSGGIACRAIRRLSLEQPDVVIIFGTHLHPDSQPRITGRGMWETPFGDIRIDAKFAANMTDLFDFDVETCDGSAGKASDNTIELQLPFVKYFFKGAKLVAIGAPPGPVAIDIGKSAAEILRNTGARAKIIGSTDLTHYGSNYDFMPEGTGEKALEWAKNENDRRIIEAMLEMNPGKVLDEALENKNACCGGAAAAAIAASKNLGAAGAELTQYRSSHDISPGSSFVGYAGIVFSAK